MKYYVLFLFTIHLMAITFTMGEDDKEGFTRVLFRMLLWSPIYYVYMSQL